MLAQTTSGGACVNEVIVHVMQDDLPFGGCGNSGMGSYHGEQGFRTFSHAKGVYIGTKRDLFGIMRPPYGKALERVFRFQLRR